MFLKNKQNFCYGLFKYQTGYKGIYYNWLIVVITFIILNILIIVLAIYFLFVINQKDVTVLPKATANNSDIIDKSFLDKIINHFENQKKVGDNWQLANHILIDPSVSK